MYAYDYSYISQGPVSLNARLKQVITIYVYELETTKRVWSLKDICIILKQSFSFLTTLQLHIFPWNSFNDANEFEFVFVDQTT